MIIKRLCRGKHVLIAILAMAALCLPAVWGQTKQDIDAIRVKQGALAPGDDQKIASFVSVQLDKLAAATTEKDLNDLFNVLIEISRSAAPPGPGATEYRNEYAKAVKQSWQRAMNAATARENHSLARLSQQAIAIIIGQTDHHVLIDDAVALLKQDNQVVRYWGAKALSGQEVRQYLETTPDALGPVLAALSAALDTPSESDVVAQIALAGSFPDSAGVSLLIKCALTESKAYQQWSLTCNETAGSIILQQIILLATNPAFENNNTQIKELLLAAAGLYSAAYQRFIKGVYYITEQEQQLELLPEYNKIQLQSLLIEMEREFMRISQSTRPRPLMAAAMQRPPQYILVDLKAAYENLLGMQGDVAQKFGIYASEQNYQDLQNLVSDPPAKLVNRARALENIMTYEPPKRDKTPSGATVPGRLPAGRTRQ